MMDEPYLRSLKTFFPYLQQMSIFEPQKNSSKKMSSKKREKRKLAPAGYGSGSPTQLLYLGQDNDCYDIRKVYEK